MCLGRPSRTFLPGSLGKTLFSLYPLENWATIRQLLLLAWPRHFVLAEVVYAPFRPNSPINGGIGFRFRRVGAEADGTHQWFFSHRSASPHVPAW